MSTAAALRSTSEQRRPRALKTASRKIFAKRGSASRRQRAYAFVAYRENAHAYEKARQDRQSLQTDPIGYADDTNLYAYVANDPLNQIDPTGQNAATGCAAGSFAGPIGCAIGAVIGTIVVVAITVLTSDTPQADNEPASPAAEESAADADNNDPEPERPLPPPPATPTQRIVRNNLDDKTLQAARREQRGEVVARRSDGSPYDHVTKVREAQQGLVNRIKEINGRLSNPSTPAAERAALQRELSEASRGLDRSEQFLPRP